MRIPFCPLPIEKAKKVSKKFSGPAQTLSKFGNLKLQLEQAKMPVSPVEYMSITLFSATFFSIIISILLIVVTATRLEISKSISLGVLVGIVIFVAVILYLKNYPKLIVKKRVANIERNLLHALKHLLVHIKAGVPLYDGIVSITRGNYGSVSDELEEMIEKVDTGTSMEDALEEISLKNPSQIFRRSIWQISNGMKGGSDIGDVLREIITNISQEQIIAIRKYGSQLNPLTMVYMMIAVIIPALGTTFLFVFSSFSPLPISEFTFYMIIIGLALLQFIYMGMIRSKRPNI